MSAKPRSKLKLTVGAAAILAVIVPASEGIRQYVYRDPVGIPTYCFGETENPEWGKKYTLAECKGKLIDRLAEFNAGVQSCVKVPMSDERRAAFVSFSYNVGTGAFCKSTLVRRVNAGDPNACDELMKWTRAKGIELPGLVRRRKEEMKLCKWAS